ncbi:MAG: hypothetical protein WC558_07920 [Patulibacter sp.]
MTVQPPRTSRTGAARRRVVAVALGTALALGIGAGGASAELIQGVAGSGVASFSGDGGPALQATLTAPSGAAPQPDGGVLIADTGNHRIRRIAPDGTITTVAGSGPCCGAAGALAGDGLAATDPAVRLNGPRAVAVHPDGRILIADTENHQLRAITPAGLIVRVAGAAAGTAGYSTGGGPAATSLLDRPSGVAVAADGAILVADTGNDQVLRIAPGTTVVSRVAGLTPTFGPGYNGDGIAATAAQLNGPTGLAVAADGTVLIADTGNHRIRAVDGSGTISTVAGSGVTGPLLGDGGPATGAALASPEGVAAGDGGSVLIADTGHALVRSVGADGLITTLAGDGTVGGLGDGGDPRLAELSALRGVAIGPRGPLLLDTGNHRVREVVLSPPVATPPGPPVVPTPPAPPVPELRRAAVATPLRGRIRVRVPGARRFAPTGSALALPMGTEIDATDGAVEVRFRTTRGGREAIAVVSEGRFVLRQSGALDGGQYPGVLVLSGPLRHCPSSNGSTGRTTTAQGRQAGPRAAKRPAKRKRGRRISVDARGKIKTRGQYGAATVRGTRWTMIDRCPRDPRPGTLTIVREGRVAVDAFVLKRRTLVRAGRQYLAPARHR